MLVNRLFLHQRDRQLIRWRRVSKGYKQEDGYYY